MPALLLEELLPLLIVLVGLAYAALQHSVSKGFVSWLAHTAARFPIFGGLSIKAVVGLTSWITHHIGTWWRGLEPGAAAWMGGMVQWVAHVLWQAVIWPYWLVRVTDWLVHVHIPRAARASVTHVTRVVRGTVKVIEHDTKVIYRIPHLTRAQIKAALAAALGALLYPYLSLLHWLKVHRATIAHVIEHAPTLPRFPDLTGLRKRVGRLEHRLTPLAIAGLVIAALARLGLQWLRCRNVTKVGRAICGTNTDLLDSLLLDTVAILSVVSVVEFANDLRAIEGEALGIAGKLIREWPT